jgi:hypothetical protein
MARNQGEERPVSEEEFDGFGDKIREHFDRVRDALDDARDE